MNGCRHVGHVLLPISIHLWAHLSQIGCPHGTTVLSVGSMHATHSIVALCGLSCSKEGIWYTSSSASQLHTPIFLQHSYSEESYFLLLTHHPTITTRHARHEDGRTLIRGARLFLLPCDLLTTTTSASNDGSEVLIVDRIVLVLQHTLKPLVAKFGFFLDATHQGFLCQNVVARIHHRKSNMSIVHEVECRVTHPVEVLRRIVRLRVTERLHVAHKLKVVGSRTRQKTQGLLSMRGQHGHGVNMTRCPLSTLMQCPLVLWHVSRR